MLTCVWSRKRKVPTHLAQDEIRRVADRIQPMAWEDRAPAMNFVPNYLWSQIEHLPARRVGKGLCLDFRRDAVSILREERRDSTSEGGEAFPHHLPFDLRRAEKANRCLVSSEPSRKEKANRPGWQSRSGRINERSRSFRRKSLIDWAKSNIALAISVP